MGEGGGVASSAARGIRECVLLASINTSSDNCEIIPVSLLPSIGGAPAVMDLQPAAPQSQ